MGGEDPINKLSPSLSTTHRQLPRRIFFSTHPLGYPHLRLPQGRRALLPARMALRQYVNAVGGALEQDDDGASLVPLLGLDKSRAPGGDAIVPAVIAVRQ